MPTRLLDYATQVSELEKIAKLSGKELGPGVVPQLLGPDESASCLVCGKRPARACGACRSVSYCEDEHQRADARFHDAVCADLRDIADDAREQPGEIVAELVARAAEVRVLRGFQDLGSATPARRRRLSHLATRPLTLASALTALGVRTSGVLSVHVMAASAAEAEVPLEVWAALLPARLELSLVGPELPPAPEARHGELVVRTRRALYARELWGELGTPDLVIGYDCGLLMYPTWKSTILGLRGSGVPFVITSYREWEAAAEARLLTAVRAKCLLGPAANPFRSLAGKRSSTIANDLSFDNAFVSAWS